MVMGFRDLGDIVVDTITNSHGIVGDGGECCNERCDDVEQTLVLRRLSGYYFIGGIDQDSDLRWEHGMPLHKRQGKKWS